MAVAVEEEEEEETWTWTKKTVYHKKRSLLIPSRASCAISSNVAPSTTRLRR